MDSCFRRNDIFRGSHKTNQKYLKFPLPSPLPSPRWLSAGRGEEEGKGQNVIDKFSDLNMSKSTITLYLLQIDFVITEKCKRRRGTLLIFAAGYFWEALVRDIKADLSCLDNMRLGNWGPRGGIGRGGTSCSGTGSVVLSTVN